jgi:hypothetical protein
MISFNITPSPNLLLSFLINSFAILYIQIILLKQATSLALHFNTYTTSPLFLPLFLSLSTAFFRAGITASA